MKTFLLILIITLSGCGSPGSDKAQTTIVEPAIITPTIIAKDVYVISGQSNAYLCDWSYFEDLTGAKTVMMAISGQGIDYLIKAIDRKIPLLEGRTPNGILFVHGETDSTEQTQGYSEKVEEYRLLIGDYPMLFSTVGYFGDSKKDQYPDELFDSIRNEVIDSASLNDMWSVVFNDAQNFAKWGMLKQDDIHFTQDGCMMMMDAFAEGVYALSD